MRIVFLECADVGGWRAIYNHSVKKFAQENGIELLSVQEPSPYPRLYRDDVLLVGDTQEKRWHTLIVVAKEMGLKVYGHKHGGRRMFLDYANVYEYENTEEFELSLFDKIFINSEWEKEHYPLGTVVTGFPYDLSLLDAYHQPKVKNSILINSRLTEDKNPLLLIDFLSRYCKDYHVWFTLPQEVDGWVKPIWEHALNENRNWRVWTGLEREKYLEIVAQSEFVLNFALAESLGISVIEAIELGAIPLVPRALAYKEYIDENSCYEPYLYSNICALLKLKHYPEIHKQKYDYKEVLKRYMEEMDYGR